MKTLEEIQRKFPRKPSKRFLEKTLVPMLSSVECFNASFWTSVPDSNHGCDMDKANSFFMFLKEKCTHDEGTRTSVRKAMEQLTSRLPSHAPPPASLRVYLMVPFCDCLEDAGHTILYDYLNSLVSLNDDSQQIIVSWLETLSREHFKKFVKIFKNVLGRIIRNMQERPTSCDVTIISKLRSCAWLLENLYKVNGQRKDTLDNDSFYLPEMSACVDIEKDRRLCHKDSITACQMETGFHFCHYPFLYDVECKTRLLNCHNCLRSTDGPHSAHGLVQVVFLLSIYCWLYRPLFFECEDVLPRVPDMLLIAFHCFVVLYTYGFLAIFGDRGAELIDAYFRNGLLNKFPFIRCFWVFSAFSHFLDILV